MKLFHFAFLALFLASCGSSDDSINDCNCDSLENKRWYIDIKPFEGANIEDFELVNGNVNLWLRTIEEGQDVDIEYIENYAKYELIDSDGCSIRFYDVSQNSFMGANPSNENIIKVENNTCDRWTFTYIIEGVLVDERP